MLQLTGSNLKGFAVLLVSEAEFPNERSQKEHPWVHWHTRRPAPGLEFLNRPQTSAGAPDSDRTRALVLRPRAGKVITINARAGTI